MKEEEKEPAPWLVRVAVDILFGVAIVLIAWLKVYVESPWYRHAWAIIFAIGLWVAFTPFRRWIANFITPLLLPLGLGALYSLAQSTCGQEIRTFEDCVKTLHSPDSQTSPVARNIRSMARRVTTYEDAEDIVQQTVLNVCEEVEKRPIEDIPSYFGRSVENARISVFRKRRSRRECEFGYDPLHFPTETNMPWEYSDVAAAIDCILNEDEKRLMLDYVATGHSSKEIAAAFGMTPEAARKQISRVRAKLRDGLERSPPQLPEGYR